ncbi:hypothetical protein BS47DRAFT_1362865 [Hydnum rufescens UP504]|uniref:Uncharacterized protein n=1 Tax=Hydnum rufescens UP504 TaxID=1448309 RepID=A0A9P6AVS4_9AGAM|nr:hypothetical protein BS47DRAFT_1362865 [Hydnum rufescens UP504]
MTTHPPLCIVWSKEQQKLLFLHRSSCSTHKQHPAHDHEAMMKSRKTESHTLAGGQHTPPQCMKSHSHKPNLWAHQDPMKCHTPLCMNMPTNKGQCMPEATGNEGATHPLWWAKMPHPNA